MTKKHNIHYIHYLSQSAREKLVGFFFVFSLLILCGLVIIKVEASKIFEDVISYHAYMKNAQGINKDTLVNISGIDIGKVSNIEITNDNTIHIEFFVYNSFKRLIRTDSKGVLSKLSLIGNSIIMLTAGNSTFPLLPEGSEITIEEPITTDDLLEGILPIINDLDSVASYLADIIAVIEPDIVEDSSQKINMIFNNIEKMTTQITSGQGMIGKALYNQVQADKITALLSSTANALAAVEKRVDEVQPLLKNLTIVSEESKALMSDVHRSLRKIDKTLDHLPEVVIKAHSVLQTTDDTLQGVQKIWPLSSSMPEPIEELMINTGSLHD